MITKKSIPLLLCLLPFLLFFSSEEEHHGENPMEFVGKVVNFLILFGGLTYLLYKPVRRFLEEKGKEISHSIQASRDSRKEAEETLKQANKRLQKLADEISRIKQVSELDGKERKDRILDSASKRAEQMKQMAQQEIEMLTQESVRQLKEHVISLSTELARKKIQQRMTPEVHSRLIDRSIERFEELNEKSNSS